MRSWSQRAWIAWSCLATACAPPPEPAAPPPPMAFVAAAPQAPAAPDLSPVDEPATLLAVARWTRPLKDLDTALGLAGVPLTLDTLIATQDPDVGALLSPDAPLDAALSLDPDSTDDDPKVLAAVSIPVTSFDGVRALAEKHGRPLAELHPGVLRLPPKRGEDLICDLVRSLGDAPARVVCGPGERDLEALRGWLARGLPRVPPEPGDVTATLRAKPLKDRYLPSLRARATKLGDDARAALAGQGVRDAELLAAPDGALDEGLKLLDDLDRIELRSSFGATPPGLVAGGTVRFGAQSSWLTHALTDVNDKAGPAPAMFWHAPRDARGVSWGRGGDPRLYDGLRRVLRKALAEGLSRVPLLRPADKDLLEAFFDGAPRAPSSWVTAQGLLPAAKRPASKGPRTPAETLADAKALAVGALGWTLVGVDTPAAEYVAWARQGLDVYTRGVRLAREVIGAAKGPKTDEPDLLGFVPRVTTTTQPPGWPRGTVAFDVLISYDTGLAALLSGGKAGPPPKGPKGASKAKIAKGSLTLRLAIVPDGDHTWIGFAADVDALRRRVIAVMPGAPTEGTIAAREGLEGLRQTGQTWAGFVSVGELLDAIVEGVEKEAPEHAKGARAALAALPNKGRTPILMVGSGTSGPAPSSTAEMRFSSGTIADLAALARFFTSPAGSALLEKLDKL